MRALAPLLLALASPGLAGCDFLEDPLGLYPAEAEDVVVPLELTGRVVDAADLLDEATEAELTTRLAALEEEVGPQLVVVTTPSLGGQTIEDYALALGRGWGIGDERRDDGVLLVVAPNQRKVRIEVGYGLENALSDPLCADIIREDILPLYEAGDLVGGTLAGAARLDSELRLHLKGEVQ